MQTDNLKYKIGIGLIPKIGPVLAKRLISYCGSIEGVFRERGRNLAKIPGIGDKISSYIMDNNVLEKAEKEVEFITKNKIKSLFYLDDNYPDRLRHCIDAPVIIFVKGEGRFKKRIIEMGFIKGAEVYVEKYAPLRDPIEFIIKGYHVSLRRDEAELIIMSEPY